MGIDYLSTISNVSLPSGTDLVDKLSSLTPAIPSVPGIAAAKAGLSSLGSGAMSKLGGGAVTASASDPNSISVEGGAQAVVSVPGKKHAKDFRVRLGPQTSAIDQVYGTNSETNILSPLRSTSGLMFPFTPSINWSQNVKYKETSLTHSNQDYYTYESTPSTNIDVSGVFVIQNLKDAKYVLACIHFLRVVSKMYFGKASFSEPSQKTPSLAGMPPPVLVFSGYGDYMFNDLPVIVKDHSYSLKPDVSYVDFEVNGGNVRLPSILDISIKLTVQNTPKKNKDEFNLDKFRTGELMKSKGWI